MKKRLISFSSRGLKKLKADADRRDIPMSELVRAIVDDYYGLSVAKARVVRSR